MMDNALATQVIETARFYMSGDNCQPFRYRFNLSTQTFHIDYLAVEAKHTFVYDDYTLLITLGSLLEYLDVTLNQHDYNIDIKFNLHSLNPFQDLSDICSITISPQKTSKEYGTTFDALKSRFTDRRPYQGPEKIAVSSSSLNKKFRYGHCHIFKDAPTSHLDFFAECDSSIWLSKPLGKDIMDAVSFNPNNPTGLPWKNLGVKKSEAQLIKLIQSYPWLFGILKSIGAKALMTAAQKKLWYSSKSFIIFTYNANLSLEDRVMASKEMMQQLLELSSQGYVFQPSTMSAEILNIPFKELNIVNSAKMSPNNYLEKITHQRELLGFDDEIQWVLRFGKVTTPLQKSALTNRHSTETLLSFE